MSISKKIKNYFKRKEILKQQPNAKIPNLQYFDNNNRTIVFITELIPTFDKDSGSNRLKEILLTYKSLNYNCVLLIENCLLDNKYIQFFAENNIITYTETNSFRSYIAFLKSLHKIDYFWYYGPNSFKNYFPTISKKFKQSKTIYDMIDIHFLRYKRAIELNPTKLSLKKRYNKYFKIETELVKKADIVVAISDKEKEVMTKYIDSKKLITVSNIHYPKIDKNEVEPFKKRKDIIFIGSTHAPNIDAVYYLYQEIMPKVWDSNPEIKLNIIGNIKDVITDVSHPNINFLGYVENIESVFLKSKMMVAPLRYGAGVKGKIGQAFEYYLPVVTTSIGAEGMFLENNTNAYITDDTNTFVNYILELNDNEEKWKLFSSNSENSLYPFSTEKLKETITEIETKF